MNKPKIKVPKSLVPTLLISTFIVASASLVVKKDLNLYAGISIPGADSNLIIHSRYDLMKKSTDIGKKKYNSSSLLSQFSSINDLHVYNVSQSTLNGNYNNDDSNNYNVAQTCSLVSISLILNYMERCSLIPNGNPWAAYNFYNSNIQTHFNQVATYAYSHGLSNKEGTSFTSIDDVFNGVANQLGLPYKADNDYINFYDTIISSIDNDIPLILSYSTDEGNGHSVVVSGYIDTKLIDSASTVYGSLRFLAVNDGYYTSDNIKYDDSIRRLGAVYFDDMPLKSIMRIIKK